MATRFNLRARKQMVTLAVEHGSVAFENLKISERVVVQSGQLSRLQPASAPITPVKVDLHNILAWREGRLAFDRTPLSEVFEELRRQFDIDVIFENANDF